MKVNSNAGLPDGLTLDAERLTTFFGILAFAT